MQITIRQIEKSFGSLKALSISEYTIPQGTLWGLVGNNGAGKSTLFRLLLDLLRADRGSICIGDMDVSRSVEWKRITGAYLDNSFLIDYLTPMEYFHFIGRMYGLATQEVDQRLETYHHFISAEVMYERRFIRNLSAGNRQKVGIIAAVLHRPTLLVLDEPFNFLDPSSQSALKHLLQAYNRESSATILLSSHNLSHTTDICQRIALLEEGVIIRDFLNVNRSAAQELEGYFNRG